MRLFSHPCGFTLLPPLLDEHMYLKNDVTKKWLFCLIKGVLKWGYWDKHFPIFKKFPIQMVNTAGFY